MKGAFGWVEAAGAGGSLVSSPRRVDSLGVTGAVSAIRPWHEAAAVALLTGDLGLWHT
jgi:hypothetical protein